MKHDLLELIKQNLEAIEHIATVAEKHDIALEITLQDHEIELGEGKKLVLNGKITVTARPLNKKKHGEKEQ